MRDIPEGGFRREGKDSASGLRGFSDRPSCSPRPVIRRGLTLRLLEKRGLTLEQKIAMFDLAMGDEVENRLEHKKVLVSGASGMTGTALIPFLKARGRRVSVLTRDRARAGDGAVFWDPESGEIDKKNLEGFGAVVHLAGENIASGRWTEARKKRIRDSRVNGTRLLAEAIASLDRKPSVLVSASAVGYYGNRNDDVLTEVEPPGKGFLAGVCREWEAATEPAEKGGVRVVRLRFGPVLSRAGGMLKKILPPFRAGVGGRIGPGRQYISWIAIDDVLGIIDYCFTHEDLKGAVNAVAPNAVTNAEFTRGLGKVLSRPTIFPVPASGLRLLYGEMADEMLLASVRAVPKRLETAGYRFQLSELEPALRHALDRSPERKG